MELANSIVTLQPGMYILRHPKTGMPALSISRAAANAAHNGQVQALYTPGTEGSILRDGKDCIVMLVLYAPVDLLVTAYLEKAGATVPALKIDRIRLDGDESPKAALDVPKKGISLIGHIERSGDVLAKAGELLGEPETEMRLEGFQVIWPDKPEGVDLAYGAQVEGAGETPLVKTGQYCGTRNAARRLVRVTFTLVGKDAGSYRLQGKARFSGGYETEIASGTAAAGPSGFEHLTGLTLSVVRASDQLKENAWAASPRTRVLRKATGKGTK